jgi:hypothetical protein
VIDTIARGRTRFVELHVFATATLTDADATPSVNNVRTVVTANTTGATSVTTFDDGTVGQHLTVIFGDANTTLVNGATLKLNGGSNMTGVLNHSISLVLVGTVWYETGRQ